MAYITSNVLVITDAAQYTVKQVKKLIQTFRAENPDNKGLAKRGDRSYINEWAVHALCYRWNIMKSRSKDADLQFDMEPEVQLMYNILGPIARLFLKFYKG